MNQVTRVAALVIHTKTKRAYSLNFKFQIIEFLIPETEEPKKFKTSRWGWTPYDKPTWSWGLRDTEFVTYFLE